MSYFLYRLVGILFVSVAALIVSLSILIALANLSENTPVWSLLFFAAFGYGIGLVGWHFIKKGKKPDDYDPSKPEPVIHYSEKEHLIHKETDDMKAALKSFYANTDPARLTQGIIATNVIIYIYLGYVSGNWIDFDSIFLLDHGANTASSVLNGEYWRLLSYAFLHGGLLHVAINMAILSDVGRLLEKSVGQIKYFSIYLVTAICAGLASISFNDGATISVGASGAVFGVIGASLSFFWLDHSILPRTVSKRLAFNALVLVVANIAVFKNASNIDHAAHMGGFASGAILGWFLVKQPKFQELSYLLVILLFSLVLLFKYQDGFQYQDEIVFKRMVNEMVQIEAKHDAYLSQFETKFKNNQIDELRTVVTSQKKEWLEQRNSLSGIIYIKEDSKKLYEFISQMVDLKIEGSDLLLDFFNNPDDEQIIERFASSHKKIKALKENFSGKAE